MAPAKKRSRNATALSEPRGVSPRWLRPLSSRAFAYAWEFTKREEMERTALRDAKLPLVRDQLTPPVDFKCQANTYGFGHGIYSKFNFFMAYLDRCIAMRMPDEMPSPGQPVKLKPISVSQGWAGDYTW